MAQDITEQATQEELADSLVSDPEPEQPQEPSDTETEEVQEPAEEEHAESEEDAEDYLPEETSKVFPDDEVNRYAEKRYPELVKALADKNLPEPTRLQLRQMLHDKLNTDIYLKTLQSQQQEELPELPEAEEPEQPEPPQQTQPLNFDQHIDRMTQAVRQNTSPEMAQWVYSKFMGAFGVAPEEVQKLAPTQAQAFTEVMSVGVLNLLNTFGSQMLGAFMPQYFEQQYPQFGEFYQLSTSARSWDSVRNSTEGGDNLPAFGSKEFATAARRIGAEIAGSDEAFEMMTFSRQNGTPLSPAENIQYKQQIIAQRMLRGEEPQVPPALMAQAVKTGERQAARKSQQSKAGNLSAGKSTAQIAKDGNEDIFAEGVELFQRHHGSL